MDQDNSFSWRFTFPGSSTIEKMEFFQQNAVIIQAEMMD